MTATTVNGLAVIASEPAHAPISTARKPVRFKQIMSLLLEDGTEMYGCLHCDYAAPSHMQVRPHLAKHTREANRARAENDSTAPREMSLDNLLKSVAKLDELTADRDTWKRRALTAEHQLKAIRSAINGTQVSR